MSAKYGKYREAEKDGRSSHASHVEFLVDDIRILAIKNTYVVSIDVHQFISDLGSNIACRSAALTGKTCTLGVLRCDNLTLPAPTAGDVVADFVVVKYTGVDSTSPLMGFVNAVTGVLPFTSSGVPINLTIDPGPYGLFR